MNLALEVEVILAARNAADQEAIRALWRIGDAVVRLRKHASSGKWRQLLSACAESAGLHPGSLDDAERCALAFPVPEREQLLAKFSEARSPITRSHVVTLARLPRRDRTSAIDHLLRGQCTVAQLRRTFSGGTDSLK